MTTKTRLRRLGLGAVIPAALAVAWWVLPSASSFYLPPLDVVLDAFRSDWLFTQFTSDLLPSLRNLVVGFVLAAVIGIGGGMVLYSFPTLGTLAEPIVHFLRSLPPPVLIPFAILLLGIGSPMKIAIIVAGSLWPTLLNTWDGARGVAAELHDMSSVYGLTGRQRIRYVILPAAGPQIFAGLRTTLQISIILIVVSEMLASTGGIGYRVLFAQQTFAVPQTWAGTLLLGIIGFLASLLFGMVERRALSWQRSQHTEARNR